MFLVAYTQLNIRMVSFYKLGLCLGFYDPFAFVA